MEFNVYDRLVEFDLVTVVLCDGSARGFNVSRHTGDASMYIAIAERTSNILGVFLRKKSGYVEYLEYGYKINKDSLVGCGSIRKSNLVDNISSILFLRLRYKDGSTFNLVRRLSDNGFTGYLSTRGDLLDYPLDLIKRKVEHGSYCGCVAEVVDVSGKKHRFDYSR